jgi:hypothetical protein
VPAAGGTGAGVDPAFDASPNGAAAGTEPPLTPAASDRRESDSQVVDSSGGVSRATPAPDPLPGATAGWAAGEDGEPADAAHASLALEPGDVEPARWPHAVAVDPLEVASRRETLERAQRERQRRRATTWRIAAALLVAVPLAGVAWLVWHDADRGSARGTDGAAGAPPVVVAARPPTRSVAGGSGAETGAPAALPTTGASGAAPAAQPAPAAALPAPPTTASAAHADVASTPPGSARGPGDAGRAGAEAGPAATLAGKAAEPAAPAGEARTTANRPTARIEPAPSGLPSRSAATTGEADGPAAAPVVPAQPASSAPAPRPVTRDFAARGNDLLARDIPRIAQRAERAVLRVLFVAAQGDDAGDDDAIRAAARALPRAHDLDGSFEPAPRDARALNESARTALNRNGNARQALRTQLGAFGANPLDPEVVGNTAFLMLRQPTPDAERARELALHALTLRDPRFPGGRVEDWTSFAIASALTGRERDARAAWVVSLALTPNLERHCRGARQARSLYGERLRTSVTAMLERARASGRSRGAPSCDGGSPQVAGARTR